MTLTEHFSYKLDVYADRPIEQKTSKATPCPVWRLGISIETSCVCMFTYQHILREGIQKLFWHSFDEDRLKTIQYTFYGCYQQMVNWNDLSVSLLTSNIFSKIFRYRYGSLICKFVDFLHFDRGMWIRMAGYACIVRAPTYSQTSLAPFFEYKWIPLCLLFIFICLLLINWWHSKSIHYCYLHFVGLSVYLQFKA